MKQPEGTSLVRAWWEGRIAVAATLFLAGFPLLWPQVPPLRDLPGHMARWHIAAQIASAGPLARYYDYHWQLIPNLGMDLWMPALGRFLGIEFAAKLGVMLIPLLTACGMLWTARETHGRLPPTAFLALPFAYAWPFQFGFLNFALAQGLLFCALALWIRLGREQRLILRALLLGPFSCVIWVAHNAGWGLLGLAAFGAELARIRGGKARWRDALMRAAVRCLPLALPAALMVLTRDPTAHVGAQDWTPLNKLLWFLSALRDRWRWFDIFSMGVVLLALYVAARDRRFGFEPLLAYPALLCTAAFLLLPRMLVGGSYVDMRVLPAALSLFLLAIRWPAGLRQPSTIAILSLGFFVVRIASTTISFAQTSAEQQRVIRSVSAIPRGASVLALVYRPCATPWSDERPEHLPAFAILRRDAFVNEQWDLAGQQLLRVRHRIAGPFTADPSQLVYPAECAHFGRSFDDALIHFPRAAFTHVWTIDAPPLPAYVRDLRPIAADGQSIVYEIRK